MVELINNKDKDGLTGISQKELWNAWYELGFGLHNDRSIHGAAPMEILNWIQLGQFKYLRQMLFKQTGEGAMGQKFNECALTVGALMHRKSDKSFPRTKFVGTVMKGILMAHEMVGLILVILVAMRSTRGRKIMAEAHTAFQKDHWHDERWGTNWILLLELQLGMLQWLKLPVIPVREVELYDRKGRELMLLTKKVGRRDEGMHFKTMNFHGLTHVSDDIKNFGVPSNVDTKSDEEHHKDDKKASKRTQHRPDSFEIQSLKQIENRRLIELGMTELDGRVRWKQYSFTVEHNQPNDATISPDEANQSSIECVGGGTKASFTLNEEGSEYVMKFKSRMKRDDLYEYPDNIKVTVATICEDCSDYLKEVWTVSEVKLSSGDKSEGYRASPHLLGKPWYDWAMRGALPVHIRCFVDLTDLPPINDTPYDAKVYMIVETVGPNMDEKERHHPSDIVEAYVKGRNANFPTLKENNIVVCPVDEITGPACVIPDLDNPNDRAFLRVQPPSEWVNIFRDFLNSPPAPGHDLVHVNT